jgi:class 3 adenylate cyclase
VKIRGKTTLLVSVLYAVPWITLLSILVSTDLEPWIVRILWVIAGAGGGLFVLEITLLMTALAGRVKKLAKRVEAVLSDSPTSRAQKHGPLLTPDRKDEIGTLYELFNYIIKQSDQTIYALATDPSTWTPGSSGDNRPGLGPIDEEALALGGDSRIVTTFHSSIESFESISEGSEPAEVVELLNEYFPLVIDTVVAHGGVVSQLIRDDVMAYFGSPVKRDNYPVTAVRSALEIQAKLEQFNAGRGKDQKHPPLDTGIGIDYGVASVANIGTPGSIHSIVIGAVVDRGSRLLRYTSKYRQPILFTESVFRKVEEEIPCRMVDRVIVKGATQAVDIYTATQELDEKTGEAWDHYRVGLDLYRNRKWQEAIKEFSTAEQLLEGDFLCRLYTKRCEKFQKSEPHAKWDGIDYPHS